MMKKPKPAPRTSIIIAVKADNAYLRECLEHCRRLQDQDFEILVMTDAPSQLNYPKTRVIPTGPVGPSEKRDRGAAAARGRLLAFLDDDTYPAPQWLSAAVAILAAGEVAAVGGPAVTPSQDGWRSQASGRVYASWLAGGPYVYRYLPRRARDVDDFPTCNLIIKKDLLQAVGGFDTCFWPGEDTVVCLKLTRELKKRIVYHPQVLVYHHRRPLFASHLRQVKSYAMHRGYFVKKYPATSLRLSYFFPTFLVLGLLAGWLPIFLWPWWWMLWLSGLAGYLGLALLSGCSQPPLSLGLVVAAGIVFTQITYGIYFVRGLLAQHLREESMASQQESRP